MEKTEMLQLIKAVNEAPIYKRDGIFKNVSPEVKREPCANCGRAVILRKKNITHVNVCQEIKVKLFCNEKCRREWRAKQRSWDNE